MKANVAQEDGAVLIWMLMATLPLALAGILIYENIMLTQTSRWMQRGVERAAKMAAIQITPGSMAIFQPQIDPVTADSAVRSSLAENLNLEPTTLISRTASLTGQITYNLVVVNGPYPYRYINTEYQVDTTIIEPSVILMAKSQFGAGVRPRTIWLRRSAIVNVVKRP